MNASHGLALIFSCLLFPLLLHAQQPPAHQPTEAFLDPLPLRPQFQRIKPPQAQETTEAKPEQAPAPTIAAAAVTASEAKPEDIQPYTAKDWQEGYYWFRDVIAHLTQTNIPYPDFGKYEKDIADELMIASDLFFDHEAEALTLLEETPPAIPNFLPFPDDALLQERMQAIENKIELSSNETVKKFIYYYGVRAHGFTRELRNRANIYFPLFEEKLRQYGMPDEIKYLAVIESALRPTIRSHAGAVGLWQFMPATGKLFGLDENYYVDERMNPEQATEAACKYLKYLYGMFGDWGLALSAYNCGPGNLKKAIRRSGGKTNFWDIYDYLPRETRSYLPQFIAVMYLFNYADEHFLAIEDPYHPIETATIQINDYVNLKRLADALMVCYDDLQNLNPELKRGIVPYYMNNYQIKIPKQRLRYFHVHRERIVAEVSAKGYYESMALTDGSAYSSFWRPVSRTRQIDYTPKASVAATPRTRSAPEPEPKKGAHKIIYTVKSGDTVSDIANHYGVSINAVQHWNNLSNSRIYPGQHLTIWADQPAKAIATKATPTPTAEPTTPTTRTHTVQSGDTLWDIARKYGITVTRLRLLNNLSSDKLQVGQQLKVG